MPKSICVLLLLLISSLACAQTSGTLRIEKTATLPPDTIKVMLGNPEYFKPIKIRYKPSPDMKVVVFRDYKFRKRVPSAYYVVTFPKTGSTQSTGEVRDGKKHGKWMFHTIEGGKITVREFDNGELLPGSKMETVGE